MKEFAKSAFTPTDKALVLDDQIQDICNTEPILDITSYRSSRIYEDKRQTAPSTQEVGGARVVGDGVGGGVGTCPATHLSLGNQHYHKITR